MDLPPDYDPRSAEAGAYPGDDEGDESEQYSDHEGNGNAAQRRPQRPRRQPAPEGTNFSHENPMYQRLIDAALLLIAPPRDASSQQLRRHSISLSIAILGIYVHIAFACGWLASIGLSGFARADTVTAMQRENADFRIMSYSAGIREFQRLYCNANYDDRYILNGHLERLKAAYQKEVGVPYVAPPCPQSD